MTLLTLGLALVAVLVGSALQRVSGTGFALVAAPFLLLLLGARDGVLLVNICGAASAIAGAWQLRRHIDLTRIRLLVPGALLGSTLGYPLVAHLPGPWLSLVVSLIAFAALLVTVAVPNLRLRDGALPRILTGMATGFGSVTSSIGGPPMAVYARATQWDHRTFAPTALATFTTTGLMATALKWPPPRLDAWQWAALGLTLVAGNLLGQWWHRRVAGPTAMRLVLGIALAGTIAALVKSILALVG